LTVSRPRPLAIDIVAVLGFVFGTAAILGACSGAGSILFISLLANSGFIPPTPGGQYNPLQAQADLYQNKIPGFIPYMAVSLVLGTLVSILLIIGSVDLFRLKPRGRTLCVIWSVYTIISSVVGMVYSLTLVIPATVEFTRESYAEMAKAGIATPEPPIWTQYTGILAGLVVVGYAIAIPILLYRRSVSDAFAGKWVPPWQEGQAGDEEEDAGAIEGEAPQGSPDPASHGIRPAQQ
jgi:hypothetical protein